MKTNGNLIVDLIRSELFQTFERAFTETTGLPVTLRPVESWQLPFHGRRKENRWCSMMAEKSRTCAACLQVQEKLTQGAIGQAATVTCAYGLFETAVPVKLGQETIGFLQTGQAHRLKPTPGTFQRAVKHGRQQGVDLEHEMARQVYFETPVVSPKKLDSVTQMLTLFADHLSIKSDQMAVQSANSEPPIVTRAKEYILEHHTEELSLGQVAEAVHSSVFYFCKLFRKVTGTTFTDYVAHIRIQQAKRLLLNVDLRISEIAYEVGFQSLTHFNRVFRNIVGESPTRYRARLPKTRSTSAS